MLTREVLGQRIADQRKRVGLTQEQLAVALGLERTAVTRIEQGKQGLDTLQLSAIADALGCPPLVFFDPAEGRDLAVLMRAPEAAARDIQRHLQWLDAFARDYEFLLRLSARKAA